MKYLGNLSLGWCLCMAMIGIAMPASSLKAQTVGVASSLQAQTVGVEYREDSLVTLVDSMMPHLDTMDGQTVFKAYFATIDKVVKPKEWADRLKADVISQVFDGFSVSDEHELYELYQQASTDAADSLKNKVKTHYETMVRKYGHLFAGKLAPDLTFIDKAGKTLSLSSFRGQTLLVDIWGTWCAPCIAEMPYLAALQKEYANRKDVRIMSIACDKKADRWKAYLAKHPTTWHQYLITEQGNKMLDDVYFCEGIPRFIIIDKQGKFINADAMRPSDKGFAEYFKKIVNN